MTGVAWLFPGQGSQMVGMARDVYDACPEARGLFEQAEEVTGIPIKRLCFEGPESDSSARIAPSRVS